MPELPEVETTLQGLKPQLEGKIIQKVVVRQPALRWPIPTQLNTLLEHAVIGSLTRRAKYLLIPLPTGTLIIHLGMSGSLRITDTLMPLKKHDHVDILLSDNTILRYNDPRRFGAILWTDTDPTEHFLLANLGPEPLTAHFNAAYLYHQSRNRRIPIKAFIMDSHVVVGVGNIYAAEALFLARIHPQLPAHQLSENQALRLVDAIKQVLQAAIQQGGTTLKDFTNSEGKPGYFAQKLQVYGRGGLPCTCCGRLLTTIKLGQRATVFCENCQR